MWFAEFGFVPFCRQARAVAWAAGSRSHRDLGVMGHDRGFVLYFSRVDLTPSCHLGVGRLAYTSQCKAIKAVKRLVGVKKRASVIHCPAYLFTLLRISNTLHLELSSLLFMSSCAHPQWESGNLSSGADG